MRYDLSLNPRSGLWVDLGEVCGIVSVMAQSPDGLDFSVYAGNDLIAKFSDKNDAIGYSMMKPPMTAYPLKVLQYDTDYSPHLGRKIYP